MDRADIVHEAFLTRLASGDLPPRAANAPSAAEAGLTGDDLKTLFRTMAASRQLDRVARTMQAKGEGFYTIASSGHEGMAAVAAAFRPSDMAFLHYRDAAFMLQRAVQATGELPLKDMALSFAASADDPISGGRHKVLGAKHLFIPPQTSTIASHLPKAVGAAFSIPMAKRSPPEHRQLPDEAVIMASFGDASVNHSTAQGAFNTAGWAAHQGSPVPLVFVCEDNGIGISTKTPAGWVEASLRARPGTLYIPANGLDVCDTYAAAKKAVDIARIRRQPVFLHLKCVRLYGHAGSDVQSAYLSTAEIQAGEANDPMLHAASLLVSEGICDASEIANIYNTIGEEVHAAADHAAQTPKLTTPAQIMASLVPPPRPCAPRQPVTGDARERLFGADTKAMSAPQHMARLLSWALTDLMAQHTDIVLAGEDIGPKGGVYGVTNKLHARFGAGRVINTPLDEQTILGLAIGMGHNGFTVIPEIQFLAYLHNAEDQVRGEAATLSFFSNGQYTNPMVIRIAGLGYQKGFGGHFHNDNSLAVLRDIPGIIIACPSNGADAVLMLRECVRLAREEQRVVAFVEPIARYATKDLHEDGDGRWAHTYPAPDDDEAIALGEIGMHGDGQDLAILTYGNGVYLSRQAEKILADQHDMAVRIVDLRWLAPLNERAILDAVAPCANVLIVDECRKTGSQSEALMALMAEKGGKAWVTRRIAADDSFIPLGPSAAATLPSRDAIVSAALDLAARRG